LLPRSLGTRPRLAIEVRPEGVIAARAEENSSSIAALARSEFAAGTALPLLRPGTTAAHAPAEVAPAPALTPTDRATLVAAVRKSLDAICQRGRETTVIVPDSAVRVLLLDFDELPGKPAEALPVVRFRLKKLLPFDADDAAISYQVMASMRGLVRVLAVAMPRELLTDYEGIVREAGFEPGAVLPSTLAALAGLPESDTARLLVNVGRDSVTTAIVHAGLLLLHRTLDLRSEDSTSAEGLEPTPGGYLDAADAAARLQTSALARELAAERAILVTETELAQAVSVATAYFEDTLSSPPQALLAAGTLSAAALEQMLAEAGFTGIPVREVVDSAMLAPGADTLTANSRVSIGWLAGVRGALAS
jgi:type IV pilus assembly protein PilM